MERGQVFGLVVTIALIVTAIYFLERLKPEMSGVTDTVEIAGGSSAAEKQKMYESAKEIVSPSGFVNISDIQLADLIGKQVILVDFWTYSCINCQRTQPYLNAWHEKYGDKGLTIVGIHTPEFEFEKDIENVRTAVAKAGIEYPVVLDNDYATWRAYGNRYWPRKYLIDIDGYIVYDHIGEGAYEETEQKIQELLRERSTRLGETADVESMPLTSGVGEEIEAQSPETYFGSLRNQNFGNGSSGENGTQVLTIPDKLKENTLYLDGTWNVSNEYAENTNSDARIVFSYQAKKVYMVARANNPVRVTVYRDGQVVKNLTIQEDQLYTLVDDSVPGEHMLELRVLDSGLQAFTFTFG